MRVFPKCFRTGWVSTMMLGLLAMSPSYAVAQAHDVPVPTVTGPIQGPGKMLMSTPVDLSLHGYVEQEFFIEGEARRYDQPPGENAVPLEGRLPYKTRIVVRRPTEENRFNGTVLLEWLNVTAQRDVDTDWIQAHEHILRSGYAWVGVSAQRAGVHAPETGLRDGNPERYGTLDVTADSVAMRDELSYDIFSQAAASLRGTTTVPPLGPLVPKVIIASGHSQSATFLTRYLNSIHPLAGIMDAFLVRGGGARVRTDLMARVFKINTETDLSAMGQAGRRQPDSQYLRTWEVAGSSHADWYYMTGYDAQQQKDFGTEPPEYSCDFPPMSRIPFRLAMFAALDHVRAWVTDGTSPPTADPIELLSTDPVEVRRDSLGHALGGIRLPHLEVPTAKNSGMNSGDGYCGFFGVYEPFDQETLTALYGTHDNYFDLFAKSVSRNVEAGFVLPIDAESLIAEARKSFVRSMP